MTTTEPSAQVTAELAAIDALVTLPQPVPVHTDDPPGAVTFTHELWWYTGTEVVGEGTTPPAPATPATGATAGTPGTWTPAGSTPPATNQSLGGITATPATPWTVGQHVVCGDNSHAYWNGSAWAAGDAT